MLFRTAGSFRNVASCSAKQKALVVRIFLLAVLLISPDISVPVLQGARMGFGTSFALRDLPINDAVLQIFNFRIFCHIMTICFLQIVCS